MIIHEQNVTGQYLKSSWQKSRDFRTRSGTWGKRRSLAGRLIQKILLADGRKKRFIEKLPKPHGY
jgi:hypothetical protein